MVWATTPPISKPTPAPLAAIRPKHIAMLMDKRKDQPTTANRLKRTFSHMFNMARRWGYTDAENPVKGVEGFALGKRTMDVSEAVYSAVWTAGSAALRDAMDLAYLTGQRPGEIHRLYVDPAWHGRGLAQRLLGALIEQAFAAGADHGA